MLWLGDGGGSTTGPFSLPGRADTFPAFPVVSRGDASGLPASEFSVGICTFSFGRMPADLGSAMLLFREGGGGGDVDKGGNGIAGGVCFSSAFVAFPLLPLCAALVSMGGGRGSRAPKPKCAASMDSLGPIGVNMLRDFAGALLSPIGCGGGGGSERVGCSFSGAGGSVYTGGIDCRLLAS